MRISPEDWRKVEPLLTAALDMGEAERAAWLEGLQADHPDVAPIVAKILATHDRAERSRALETVPRLAPAPPHVSAFSAGDRIGPFRLLRPLGRGGMGEVWLAEQADGRVTREVALKLPTALEASDIRAERFQRERDILAKLTHPNIARLYDAGVSETGQPYLAMEHVEGEPLDKYMANRELALPARLSLFRQVLAAVAHAHRHLVVHRDIKPPNILIDTTGQVKLLDFGIAKLLEDDAAPGTGARSDLTRLGGRVMTLRYAAPEQVAEGTITTATDIYSLGVVLHELVTGASPYRAVREGKPLADVMLLREDIAVPSSVAVSRPLARLVAGDLNAILLKALRRDPLQRYASVEQFDEDIRRHLERQPVHARAGTLRYLAGRFVLRHRLPIAMAAAVIATMAVGLVMIERERRVAVAERQRAEKHFASVRKLANAFIFDVHGEIETLPGSLKAREMLVKTSLEYLDALSGEAGGDPALMYELAVAYRKIGNIQGQPGAANTGELTAAIGNFEKAKRLFVALDPLRANDIATVREHTSLSYVLSRAYIQKGDLRWQAEIAETIKLATRVAALPGATPRDRARVASAMAEQAHLTSIMFGQSPEVEANVTRAIAILEALDRELPGDRGVRINLATTHQRAAEILTGNKHTPQGVRQAIGHRRKALAIFAAVLAEQPNDQRMQAQQVENIVGLAQDLSLAGEYRDADRVIGEAVKIITDLVARDPGNVALALDKVGVLGSATRIANRAGDPPRAIRYGREALAVAARLPEDALKPRDARNTLAEAKGALGFALVASAGRASLERDKRLALLREARLLLAAGVAFIAEASAEKLGTMNESDKKDLEDALRQCNEVIARLERG